MFEKQCGYQANRTGVGAKLLVSLYFVIFISLSHIDLVAPVEVIKNCITGMSKDSCGPEHEC